MGLEPTTFELEVQRADPLRQKGTALVSGQYWTKLPIGKILLHPKII